MEKTYRTILVRTDTHGKLMMFKLAGKAKSMDALIQEMIKLWREHGRR